MKVCFHGWRSPNCPHCALMHAVSDEGIGQTLVDFTQRAAAQLLKANNGESMKTTNDVCRLCLAPRTWMKGAEYCYDCCRVVSYAPEMQALADAGGPVYVQSLARILAQLTLKFETQLAQLENRLDQGQE